MDGANETQLRAEIDLLKASLAEKDHRIECLGAGNQFLETLLEAVPEEVLVIDRNYLIRNANRVFLHRRRLRREEVTGRKCHQVIFDSASPCDFGTRPCPLEKARETGRRVQVTHLEPIAGGEYREISRIMYPIPVGEGPAEHFLALSWDVTQYRDLVRKLKASERKLRAILDTATDGILSIDADHRVILYNDAAERMFGYAREEVLGRDLGVLIPPQYGDHRSHVRGYLETRQPRVVGRTLQLSALRKGGEEFPVELALSCLEIKGEVTFTAIIRDLSLQKQMERKLLQSERLAAVGQAVAHVAHEIKNPLMIIGGFSQQIRRSLSEPKAIQKLDMITDEVLRLEKLVSNLGDFTKQYRLVKRPANINAVLRDVVCILEQIHPPEKYAFRLELDLDLGEIRCDPDKLKQVFINVITNGIEAMESGGTIHTATSRWERGVDIRIRDEGMGIAENDLLHVFEQFYTTRERGSGLGLSISYRIVEAHGGEIWAVSRAGEGTTFFIRLPRET